MDIWSGRYQVHIPRNSHSSGYISVPPTPTQAPPVPIPGNAYYTEDGLNLYTDESGNIYSASP